MRGSSFQGCVFDYALFERTYIEHYILDDQCPSTENRIQIFARSLRLNFQQIGDKLGENKAIKVELDATKVHFKKACFSKESYYRNKYKGFVRAKEILSYLKFTILEKLLGNMESIPILFRNIFVILATITAIDFIKFNKNKYSVSEIFINNINLFIDGKSNPSDYPLFIVNFIILTKLLSIGCILSVLIKMSARR
jgi:hypothetical protein